MVSEGTGFTGWDSLGESEQCGGGCLLRRVFEREGVEGEGDAHEVTA